MDGMKANQSVKPKNKSQTWGATSFLCMPPLKQKKCPLELCAATYTTRGVTAVGAGKVVQPVVDPLLRAQLVVFWKAVYDQK